MKNKNKQKTHFFCLFFFFFFFLVSRMDHYWAQNDEIKRATTFPPPPHPTATPAPTPTSPSYKKTNKQQQKRTSRHRFPFNWDVAERQEQLGTEARRSAMPGLCDTPVTEKPLAADTPRQVVKIGNRGSVVSWAFLGGVGCNSTQGWLVPLRRNWCRAPFPRNWCRAASIWNYFS